MTPQRRWWLAGLALWRSRRSRPGLIALASLAAFSILAPLVLADPNASDFTLARADDGGPAGPSLAHPLGVDVLLRDVLSRLASGGRVSLAISIAAAFFASTLGVVVGIAAASAARGRAHLLDRLAVRTIDVFLALPYLLVVTAIGAAIGKSDALTMLLVLGGVGWAGTARVVRAQALVVQELPFVAAARALGAGPLHLAVRHVLPNVARLWIVVGTGTAGSMILAEAVLGYLGVGLPPPDASWGRMLHESETLLPIRPLAAAAPGAFIVIATLAWNRIGEGLRDVLADDSARLPPSPRGAWDFGIALAVFGAAVLVSPAVPRPPPEVAASPAPVRGATLRMATSVAVRSLDPALAYDEASGAIGRLVWERLLELDDEGRLVPRLAIAHTWSEGGTVLDLDLRPTARFHDGSPLTAADVVRSIERALHPKTPCPGASHFERIVGFEAYRKGEAARLAGVEAAGPHRVRFRLDRSSGGFLAVLSLGFAAPVCPGATGPVDPRATTLPCGAGPFRVEGDKAEEGVRLTRHDGYDVEGRPHLEGIEWSFNVRSTAQRFRLEQGTLDVSSELTPTDSALFEGEPSWRALGTRISGRAMNAVFLNVELPPFDREEVRRAVRLALDPEVLVKVRPDVIPLDRVVPATLPGAFREGRLRAHDLAAARAAMAAAGLAFDPTTGEGGWPHPIDYVTVGDSFEQATAEIWQQQLAKIGLRIRLRTTTFATYLAEVRQRRRVPMGWIGWGADYPDPLNFFEPTLSSRALGETSQNFAFFSDEELDALLLRADQELDGERRKALVARAEAIVHERAPWVPTHAARSLIVRQPWVRGFRPTSSVPLPLEEVWIDGRPSSGTSPEERR